MTTNFHNEYGIINKILRTHDDGAKLINGKTNEREAYDVSRSRKDVEYWRVSICRRVEKIKSHRESSNGLFMQVFLFSLLGGLSKPICLRRRKKMIISKFGLFIGFFSFSLTYLIA